MPKHLSWLRGAAVALAVFGTLVPQVPTLAAGPKPPSRPSIRVVDAAILDVALASGGKFTGRVVDHAGVPIEGAEVKVKQGEKEIATTITDRTGTFAVNQLKSGLYTFTSGSTTGAYRLWTEKTAPPSANPQGLLIMGQNGTRGQFAAVDGGGNLLIATIAAAGLAVGIITLIEVRDLQNKVFTGPDSP